MTGAIIRLVTNLPRRLALTPDTPGETIRLRILRECGRWRAGQIGSINAEYGRQLIAIGLAVEIAATTKQQDASRRRLSYASRT